MTACPNHKAGQICQYKDDCPVARYMPEKDCTDLTMGGVQMVEAWLKGARR